MKSILLGLISLEFDLACLFLVSLLFYIYEAVGVPSMLTDLNGVIIVAFSVLSLRALLRPWFLEKADGGLGFSFLQCEDLMEKSSKPTFAIA